MSRYNNLKGPTVPWGYKQSQENKYVLEPIDEQLDALEQAEQYLKHAGKLAPRYGIRLSAHPGQYTVLASPNENIVEKSIDILNKTAQFMDLMEMPKTPYCKINIHIEPHLLHTDPKL